jgi:uncharacterized phage-associated protein
MSVPALQAAKTICQLSDWRLPNLSLQRILYLAHMVYMGQHDGDPLLKETFQAWEFGPVVPIVYRHAHIFGDKPVGNVFHSIPDMEAVTDTYRTIKDAVEALGDAEPARLVALTHWEKGAWYRTYASGIHHAVIPNEDIIEEYRKRDGEP